MKSPPFKKLADADSYADQLNNIIGRNIGLNNKNSSNKTLAKLVLDRFNKDGLYTVSQNKDGLYDVQLTCLSDDAYKKAISILEKLKDYGLEREIDQ